MNYLLAQALRLLCAESYVFTPIINQFYYLLAQALHLLCVESYVVMSPFYYSNYQSISLFAGSSTSPAVR